jgi:hypothetical protein
MLRWHNLFVNLISQATQIPNFMAAGEDPIRIISNESNHVIEIEPGDTRAAQPHVTAAKEASEQLAVHGSTAAAQRTNDEVATNDGTVVETLDTAFHNKPGLAEGENLSGSDRADYYEARSQGKTDAEEELDALNDRQPQ